VQQSGKSSIRKESSPASSIKTPGTILNLIPSPSLAVQPKKKTSPHAASRKKSLKKKIFSETRQSLG